MSWLVCLYHKYAQQGAAGPAGSGGPYLDSSVQNSQIFQEFQDLRGLNAAFHDRQLALPPVSWAITMSCLVEIQLILFSFSFADGVVGICNPEAAALASFIASMVFSSILYLADEIAYPCSGRTDNFDPHVILLDSDRALYHYLHQGHLDLTDPLDEKDPLGRDEAGNAGHDHAAGGVDVGGMDIRGMAWDHPEKKSRSSTYCCSTHNHNKRGPEFEMSGVSPGRGVEDELRESVSSV
jgi:hypothetical protein